MKILSIVGTRPNFIKQVPLTRAYRRHGLEEIILHTGQHYDYQMSRVFFRELNLPEPDYIATIPKYSSIHQTASMMMFIEDILKEVRPDMTVLMGDVDSSCAGAIASTKLKIPCAHIEAGLRSESFFNPEEINRKVCDVLSSLHFPHIAEARDSLLREGYDKDRIFLVGDVICDALKFFLRKKKIRIMKRNYILLTIHRAENTDNPKRLKRILRAVIDSGEKFVFPVHPRTEKALKKSTLWEEIVNCPRIKITAPQGYLEFLKLLAQCKMVLTDSGGVRREAYILKKPTLILVNIVWVPSVVELGWAVVTDDNVDLIKKQIKNFKIPREHPPLFGDGNAAIRIAHEIKKFLG